MRDDINIQRSDRFNNGHGDRLTLNLGPIGQCGVKFRNSVEANVLSAAYVPDWKVPSIDGTIGVAAYGYVANSRAGLTTGIGVPEAAGHDKAGFGDITFVPLFMGFDVPNTDLHFFFSPFEFTAPTGRYSAKDPIGNNIGLNYWSYRPALEMTYLNATGQEFSLNMSSSINSQNPSTHYRSGDEFYFTWVGQQYFLAKFSAGVGGYYYKQIGNDTRNGQVVNTNTSLATLDALGTGPGNRGETFAIGPVVSYIYSENLSFQAHWDSEIFSYNRAQRDLVYVRGAMRF